MLGGNQAVGAVKVLRYSALTNCLIISYHFISYYPCIGLDYDSVECNKQYLKK